MPGNPQALVLRDALQIDEARAACQAIAGQRRAARHQLETALERLAERERDYRKARAVAYVRNESAPSAGMRDATVDAETAKGLVEVAEELLRQIDAERASLHRLIEFSIRMFSALEGHEEPAWSSGSAAA